MRGSWCQLQLVLHKQNLHVFICIQLWISRFPESSSCCTLSNTSSPQSIIQDHPFDRPRHRTLHISPLHATIIYIHSQLLIYIFCPNSLERSSLYISNGPLCLLWSLRHIAFSECSVQIERSSLRPDFARLCSFVVWLVLQSYSVIFSYSSR